MRHPRLFRARWTIRLCSLLLLFAVACAPLPAQDAVSAYSVPPDNGDFDVTIMGLIGEMVDLTRFLAPATPSYTTKIATSHDRASEHGNWFANSDYGRFIRDITVDGRLEHVMMEEYAPGAIMRLWSTNARGTIRIYIDDSLRPAITAPLADLLGGNVAPFNGTVSYLVCGGYSFYFPIPFSRFCRVTVDSARELYYHAGYRIYAPGTRVEPFPAGGMQDAAQAVAELQRVYEHPSAMYENSPILSVVPKTFSVSLASPARFVLRAHPGGELLRELAIRPLGLAGDLNGVTIRIHLDTVLAVDAPILSFFGTGVRPMPYKSLPMEIDSSGTMYCRWPMGFRDSMTIELRSAKTPLVASCLFWSEPRPFDPATMYYFHTGWRSENDMPSGPTRDWNLTDLRGRGIFVGNALTVGNPVTIWWGEGDDKVVVDDADIFERWGTGTEDYYGSGLAAYMPFARPYHCYTEIGPPDQQYLSWYGIWSMNRWLIPDPYPFEKRFTFDLEIWHCSWSTRISMGTMNYWYGLAGTYESHPPQSVAPVTLPVHSLPDSIPGVIEGEWLKLLYFAGDHFDLNSTAPETGPGWSRAQYLDWRSAPGAERKRIELAFTAPVPGRYEVYGYFVRGAGFGSFDLSINGRPADHRIDLEGDSISATGPIALGEFDLTGDEERMIVSVPDTAAASIGKRFGLDAIRLQPVSMTSVSIPSDDGLAMRWMDDGTIGITTGISRAVRIEAIDLLGNVVAVIADRQVPAGKTAIDAGFDRLPHGAYFVRMIAGDELRIMRGIRTR